MAHVQRSELIAFFTDYEKACAPQDGPTLRLTVCADIAFLQIGHMIETGADTATTFTGDDAHCVGVDVELLYQTLGAMLRRSDRLAHELLVAGEVQPGDTRVVAVERSVAIPATRVRA